MATGAAVSRRLTLVGTPEEERFMERALKIAFATSDRTTVNQHFGSSEGFAIYYVTPDDAVLAEVVAFEEATHDGNEDKLVARIAALSGCAAVYCRAVGASAIAQLKHEGVQPLKVMPGTAIKAQIAGLQDELRREPALWVLRALAGEKSASRFDEMDAAGWVE